MPPLFLLLPTLQSFVVYHSNYRYYYLEASERSQATLVIVCWIFSCKMADLLQNPSLCMLSFLLALPTLTAPISYKPLTLGIEISFHLLDLSCTAANFVDSHYNNIILAFIDNNLPAKHINPLALLTLSLPLSCFFFFAVFFCLPPDNNKVC